MSSFICNIISMKRSELYFRNISTRLWTIPWIFLVMLTVRYIWWFDIDVIVLLSMTIFSSYAVGTGIKFFYYKPRPQPQRYKNIREKIESSSFPSMHTANSIICAFFGIMLTITSGMLEKWIWWVISIIWRFLFFVVVSLSRIALQKHYPIDIVAWTLFGILILLWILMVESEILWLVATIIF